MCFLGVRYDGTLEKVNCINGKIEELMDCGVQVPTDMQYMGNGMVLIASKINSLVNVVNIRKKNVVKEFSFQETIGYIDHFSPDTLILQYFNNNQLCKLELG